MLLALTGMRQTMWQFVGTASAEPINAFNAYNETAHKGNGAAFQGPPRRGRRLAPTDLSGKCGTLPVSFGRTGLYPSDVMNRPLRPSRGNAPFICRADISDFG